MNPSRRTAIPISLFLSLWLFNGVLINSSNLTEFNLQQMGIEAIVERGHFYVEGSRAPQLKPGEIGKGDVFEYDGHLYAGKQPGQFLLGALAYLGVHATGLSYVTDFVLTSALVTFLTTSLITALAGTMVLLLAWDLMPPGRSVAVPLAIAAGFSLATTALPYAGIAHHDAIASSLLLLAFASLFRSTHTGDPGHARVYALAAGSLLGAVVTTSMLPFFMVIVALLYWVSFRQWRQLLWMGVGLAIGLAPLLLYDAINFGNPFTLPNIAGDFSDTFFSLDGENFRSKLVFYGTFLVEYTPLVLWGFVGLAYLPARFRREQLAMLGMVTVLAAYVLNIDTVGHCQYGPRYFLPAMPFLALGLAGIVYLPIRPLRWAVAGLAGATALYSAAANITGAMFGAMYCDIQWYAFPYYLKLWSQNKLWAFPLAAWLALPLGLCVVVLAWSVWPRRNHRSTAAVHAENTQKN